MRLMTVVGARPQFIKAAMVSRAIQAVGAGRVSERLVHTGQHYDASMSAIFFDELEIRTPDVNLSIGSAPHGAQTGQMMAALEELLLRDRPDWVLVYGDTNSTLAGALAATKLNVRVAHVEAGLRSYNRRMPEEINRVVTDHLADVLYAPTTRALSNLRLEGVARERIEVVGDVMLDAALRFGPLAATRSRILNDLGLTNVEFILCTVHRAENTDDTARLLTIFEALSQVALCLPVIVPVHPRTLNALASAGFRRTKGAALQLIEPVGYLDATRLTQCARLVVTDSGGLQKEAFFHGRPCLTLRTETEWTELVELGWNRLVPPTDTVAEVTAAILEAVERPLVQSREARPFGSGTAAEGIVASLLARTHAAG